MKAPKPSPVDPDKAEQAVEDLATLFRASLRDSADVGLDEELALCRRYANIEELRLGDRLHIDWQVPENAGSVRIPAAYCGVFSRLRQSSSVILYCL